MEDSPVTSTTIRLIARDEISQALAAHLSLCPLAGQDLPARLRSLEISYARLIGYMIGSGLIAGLSSSALSRLIPGT
jgi:hypothetical protein